MENVHRADDLNSSSNRPQILIVDDEMLNIEIVQILLIGKNIKTESALSGKQALEKIKKRAQLMQDNGGEMFKVILLDYCMTEMDGPETARQIRQFVT